MLKRFCCSPLRFETWLFVHFHQQAAHNVAVQVQHAGGTEPIGRGFTETSFQEGPTGDVTIMYAFVFQRFVLFAN